MRIEWGAFLAVLLVSLGSTIVVVMLVAVALVEISARREPLVTHLRHAIFSSRLGIWVAGACLTAAAALVLFGLYEIVRGSGH